MPTPLMQYWTEEIARLTPRVATQRSEVTAQRAQLTGSRALRVLASAAVTAQTEAVEAARKALAGIPMPADGDPLLAGMETALVALAEAQATLATTDLAVQAQSAELARLEAQQAGLEEELAAALRQQKREEREAEARGKMITALTTGELATLAADAAAALTAYETTARARVEGEFPSSTTAAKSFLGRVRARRAQVQQSLVVAADVESAAFTADTGALAQAQRRFERAAAAVRTVADAAPQLESDRATLQRFSELPAATATSFPILTRWQHGRLHDGSKKTAREAALAKLTAVDTAVANVRPAQQAYDKALHAAMKSTPDKTQAELDASTLATERAALQAKIDAVGTARAAMTAAELETVKSWFAAVPENLWEALDRLDAAADRLNALKGPSAPANVLAELAAAETALATALTA
ncbi:MAG TPA: hypothetical protein VGD76_15485, partial [Ramlibacter sp.]